jgi:hypothetical protein
MYPEVPCHCTGVTAQKTGFLILFSSLDVRDIHFRGRSVHQAQNQQKQAFLTWFSLRPWQWMLYFPTKRWAISEPQDDTTQKIALFVVTVLRTSNLWKGKEYLAPVLNGEIWGNRMQGHLDTSCKFSPVQFCHCVSAIPSSGSVPIWLPFRANLSQYHSIKPKIHYFMASVVLLHSYFIFSCVKL